MSNYDRMIIKRIAAALLCAFIFVSFMPDMTYAFEEQQAQPEISADNEDLAGADKESESETLINTEPEAEKEDPVSAEPEAQAEALINAESEKAYSSDLLAKLIPEAVKAWVSKSEAGEVSVLLNEKEAIDVR